MSTSDDKALRLVGVVRLRPTQRRVDCASLHLVAPARATRPSRGDYFA